MKKEFAKLFLGTLFFLPLWFLFIRTTEEISKIYVTDLGWTILIGYLFINIAFSVIDPIVEHLVGSANKNN